MKALTLVLLLVTGAQVAERRSSDLSRIKVLKIQEQDAWRIFFVSDDGISKVEGASDVQSHISINAHSVYVRKSDYSRHVGRPGSVGKEAHTLVPAVSK